MSFPKDEQLRPLRFSENGLVAFLGLWRPNQRRWFVLMHQEIGSCGFCKNPTVLVKIFDDGSETYMPDDLKPFEYDEVREAGFHYRVEKESSRTRRSIYHGHCFVGLIRVDEEHVQSRYLVTKLSLDDRISRR